MEVLPSEESKVVSAQISANTKKCKKCEEEKTLDQYYKTKQYYMGTCKKCHTRDGAARLKAKYSPAPRRRGFNNLPEDKRLRIIADVAAQRALRAISVENDVSVDQLRSWKRNGLLTAGN